MEISRRSMVRFAGAAGLLGLTGSGFNTFADTSVTDEVALPDMAAAAVPISAEEHQARLDKVQELMRARGIAGLVVEAGSALVYFTGIQWWRSERFTGVIITAEGSPVVITPYFEEPSVRESVRVDLDFRTWNEHENPFDLVTGLLQDQGLSEGRIAIEETARHFVSNGVAQAAPGFEIVSGMSADARRAHVQISGRAGAHADGQ